MPLTGKYLKYQTEITFDIFKLVWDRLLELGWRENSNSSIKSRWVEFTGKYPYFRHTTKKEFNTHEDSEGRIETTVQEILGYDPFVKEEVIPEYAECTRPEYWTNAIKENNGNLIFDTKNFKFSYYSNTWEYAINHANKSNFKPSTKEAFDAQNKPKFIEKWSLGTYVLFLKDLGHFKTGYIDVINDKFDGRCASLEKYLSMDIKRENDGEVKWFATKSEAKEFAKTLVEEVKEEVKTPQLDLNEWLNKYKKLNLAVNDLANAIELSNFDKVFLKLEGTNSKEKANILYNLWNPKQLLKQAVHCKNQEEYKAVKEFYNSQNYGGHSYKKNDCIPLDNPTQTSYKDYYANNNYKLLSFQEWRDLNGYKMEKEVKFEVGEWVCNKSMPFIIGKIDQIKGELVHYRGFDEKEHIRHATPEEINNHLISIGQIPAGEPLNTGIEPNKDGIFKYKTVPGTSWSGGTIQNHLEAMIPTTGNSYDKEFSTGVIPEYLLNTQKKAEVEFNYLPEPK